jgi:ribosomal protein S18 acetylase RimI-like enzyme
MNVALTYRTPSVADAEAVARLYGECFDDTFAHLYKPEDLAAFHASVGPEKFAVELADPGFRFRLCEDGQPVGFIKLGPAELPVETPPATIELRQLYVLKPWQGAGVAASLMDWALDQARAAGFRHIQLNVYVDNQRAQRFYARYGFRHVGRYTFMVGNHPDEELVMRLSL